MPNPILTSPQLAADIAHVAKNEAAIEEHQKKINALNQSLDKLVSFNSLSYLIEQMKSNVSYKEDFLSTPTIEQELVDCFKDMDNDLAGLGDFNNNSNHPIYKLFKGDFTKLSVLRGLAAAATSEWEDQKARFLSSEHGREATKKIGIETTAIEQEIARLKTANQQILDKYNPVGNLDHHREALPSRPDSKEEKTQKKEEKTQDTELLILIDPLDLDLLKVINMRAKVCQEKGNELIVMSYKDFSSVMSENPAPTIRGINKLSFLHHSARGMDLAEEPYAEKVGAFAKQMPDLREIVLRGCGTTQLGKGQITKEKDFQTKKHTIKFANAENQDLQGSLIVNLFQKKNEFGKLITYITYKDSSGTIHKEQSDLIPESNKKTGVTEELFLALQNQFRNLPPIQPPTPTSQRVAELRTAFFNPNAQMTKEEKKQAKACIRRARTEVTLQHAEGSFAKKVTDSLDKAQCSHISVKAYIGGYEAGPDRAIAFRSTDNTPKALENKPKPASPRPQGP